MGLYVTKRTFIIYLLDSLYYVISIEIDKI
jgi:hypothetical protein